MASMFSSLALLAVLLLQASTSTGADVSTITTFTVSDSYSTSQTLIEFTSTYENIQTITTVDASGNSVTSTTDEGAATTVIGYTSSVVATIPVTIYITSESTIATSATDDNVAAATSSPSVVKVSSSTDSLGITYASTATVTTSAHGRSTVSSTSSQTGTPKGTSSSTQKDSPAFKTGAPQSVKSSGMSIGAKAAIGTAMVVLVIFLAILFFWLDRLRRQRKAIREQYPDGQAPGDETGIFGFFSPIVGRPYDKVEKPETDIKMAEKAEGMGRSPSTMVRELSPRDITPPAVQEPQPYRRPIPQRNPRSLHSPVSPISPVHDSFPESPQRQYGRSSVPDDNASDLSANPFEKGFPHRLSRFPSQHATKRSSGNIMALPEFSGNG